MIEEEIRLINTIREEINSGRYKSQNCAKSTEYSSHRIENIDNLVDRVLEQHNIPVYGKEIEKKCLIIAPQKP